MINKLRGVSSILQVIVATIAIFSNDVFKNIFKRSEFVDYYWVPLILVTIVAMRLSDVIPVYVLEKSRWLRKRISGKDDIEGEWAGVVINAKTRTMEFAEFYKIIYKGGKYVLSGDDWSPEGVWCQEFSSTISDYEHGEFVFTFRTRLKTLGFGKLIFFPHDTIPTNNFGKYQEENKTEVCFVKAKKVSADFRNLQLEQRGEIALEFAKHVIGAQLASVVDLERQFY